MLKQGQSNGYIGKAELSKNRKKNKSTIFFNIFAEISTWSPAECNSTGLHVEFFQNYLKRYFCFFYGGLFFVTKSIFQLQRPKTNTKYI